MAASPGAYRTLSPQPDAAGATVAICPRAADPRLTVDLAVSPLPTRLVAIESIPTFLSLAEALAMLLPGFDQPTAASTTAANGEDATAEDDTAAATCIVEAARVAMSPSPATFTIVLLLRTRELAARLCERHHMRRLSTLAEERLVVRHLCESALDIALPGVTQAVEAADAVDGAAAAASTSSVHATDLASGGGCVPLFPYLTGQDISNAMAPPLQRQRSNSGDRDRSGSPMLPHHHGGGNSPHLARPGGSPAMEGASPALAHSIASAGVPPPFAPLPVPAGGATPTSRTAGPRPRGGSRGASLGGTPATAGAPALPNTSLGATLSAAATSAACSICLEPLGRAPVITLPCEHAFDLACFARVEEGACPLCRFNVAEARASCATCGATSDLWLCLVCGAVLCGRYHQRDAQRHYQQHLANANANTGGTSGGGGHRYFMQVGGLRVWDMASDAFVHRLIATADGAMRQAPGTGSDEDDDDDDAPTHGPSGAPARFNWADFDDDSDAADDDAAFGGGGQQLDAAAQSRLDAIATFYGMLMEELLAAQHQHFVAAIDDEHHQALAAVLASEADERAAMLHAAASELAQLVDESLAAIAGASRAAKKRLAAANERRRVAVATVGALRANVAKLDAMVASQQSSSPPGSAPAAAAATNAAAAGGGDDEIARLEAKLQELYAQFT